MQEQDEFSRQVSAARESAGSELLAFLKQNKKWWLTPIVVMVLLLGALVVLGGSAAAPFIYTLF